MNTKGRKARASIRYCSWLAPASTCN